ncbi:MAG TPA: hypothetical protein VHC98_03115 [Candidatus Saccharimonadales bacterium]|nr:hypothetical protein [Candidatus Saccharimonadales bacterium]
MTRYVVGFLLAVGLIVVVIVLIIRALTAAPSGPKPLDLNSYAGTDTTVQLTIDSPVASESAHHDIVITVGNLEATLTVTQGYDNQIVRMKSYQTTTAGYATFLHALSINGFAKGNSDPNVADERGQCALGDRYIFEVLDSTGHDLERYWYTSCGNGTFKGKVGAVRNLFQLQIPDYVSLTSGINL